MIITDHRITVHNMTHIDFSSTTNNINRHKIKSGINFNNIAIPYKNSTGMVDGTTYPRLKKYDSPNNKYITNGIYINDGKQSFDFSKNAFRAIG